MKPARKITNSGTRKNIGKFPSRKMQATIWFESLLERDYIYLLEIDPDVLSFYGQPFKVLYTSDSKQRKYTPDFFVERRNEKQVIEVKPASKASSDKNLSLFQKVTPICEEKGWKFIVVTEEVIRVQPRLSNIKILFKYSDISVSPQKVIECKKYFERQESSVLKDIEKNLASKEVDRNTLFMLLYFGFLETDLDQPLNSDSILRLSQTNYNLKN